MFIICCFLSATVPPTDENNHQIPFTINTSPEINSIKNLKPQIPSNNSETVENSTVNAPFVFPSAGYTTLSTILEKLPVKQITQVPGELAKNTTTQPIVNTVSLQEAVPKNTNRPSSALLEKTTRKMEETTDLEVPDLLRNPLRNTSDVDLQPASPKIIYNSQQTPDRTVIRIDDGKSTEDEIKSDRQTDEPHVALIQGQMAAILAGVFVCCSVVGYIALLSWRRYLE